MKRAILKSASVVVMMTLFLSASRLTPAEASTATATRFDSVLSLQEVELSPELDSPVVHHAVESESSLTTRGFDAGFQAGSDAGYESGYESGLKSGHDAGFTTGFSEGRDQMVADVRAELLVEHTAIMLEHSELRAKLEIAVNTLASGLSSLESATIPVYTEVGVNLGNVVVELVEGLLGAELSTDKAHVVNSISSAAAEIPGHSEVRVALHPDDLEIIQGLGIDFEEALQRPVRLLADDSIELHGAVVTSGCTRVDSQISQRITQLKEALSS
jgi:flagellar biosynthesis/type III secretory pathway protein FliH